MKNVLFVHNNFPAQFLHVARALSSQPGIQLAAIGTHTARRMPGVRLMKYSVSNPDVGPTHPFARRFDLECRRAEEVLYAASSLSSSGFVPDIVFAHPGWGEAMPLRAIFPKSRLIAYCEFFYRVEGRDNGFDPEFPLIGIDGEVSLQLKNAATLLALVDCDVAISPTQWQRSTFPEEFRPKIEVVHEGVDVNQAKPSSRAQLRLPSGRLLTGADEVVTFAARNFEPVRGFHIFTRALPRILAARPQAQILCIGGEGNPYGASPPNGQSWKKLFFDEIADQVDVTRIHFAGHLTHADFLSALQISSAHVYLTYPFVLSWSLLEAMSTGCLVIASATPPVEEVVNSDNGVLVPFFDVDQLADRVIEALAHPRRFKSLRARARATIVNNFGVRQVCLPKLLDLLGLETNKQPAEPSDPVPVSIDEVFDCASS
jgi:glycosyltransferase involved in cell wall biosynthesis